MLALSSCQFDPERTPQLVSRSCRNQDFRALQVAVIRIIRQVRSQGGQANSEQHPDAVVALDGGMADGGHCVLAPLIDEAIS
jgi:hypothetical protein